MLIELFGYHHVRFILIFSVKSIEHHESYFWGHGFIFPAER